MISPTFARTLRFELPYMRGRDVLAVQGRLNLEGDAALSVDGVYGSRTSAAVKAYQAERHLGVDGTVGTHTWKALFEDLADGDSPATVSFRATSARLQGLLPSERPKLSARDVDARIAQLGIDREKYKLMIVGIRGYFGELGRNPGNERGIYDDAIFVHSIHVSRGFNANTDPTRMGLRPNSRTGLAVLDPGVWYAYKFSKHNKSKEASRQYEALCQDAADVTVTRDENPPRQQTGRFGINIHKGRLDSTSSEGCQTIHPSQWEEFYTLCRSEADACYPGKNFRDVLVPYALVVEGTRQPPSV